LFLFIFYLKRYIPPVISNLLSIRNSKASRYPVPGASPVSGVKNRLLGAKNRFFGVKNRFFWSEEPVLWSVEAVLWSLSRPLSGSGRGGEGFPFQCCKSV
jgi:hypothetical protein